MADKFRNTYRIASARWAGWDYGRNAAYFVTICTRDRIHYFGDVRAGRMELSPIGALADRYWREIPAHFPYVRLDAHVIMPNHVHGIVVIDRPDGGDTDGGGDRGPNDGDTTDGRGDARTVSVETPDSGVSTPQRPDHPERLGPPRRPGTETPHPNRPGGKNPKWKPGVLGVIINQYKRICTIQARKIDPDFGWQSRFHDHVIRTATSHDRIRTYILNNPAQWSADRFYSQPS